MISTKRPMGLVAAGFALALVTGCTAGLDDLVRPRAPDQAAADAQDTGTRPEPRPGATGTATEDAPGAPLSAMAPVTVEDLDTTSPAERSAAAASAPEERPERELGRTIAALGDPADAGFWAKTPLVSDVQDGRLVYPLNGKSVLVELRPLDAEPGAGSQVSLAAMRILGAPLSGLPELIVLAR